MFWQFLCACRDKRNNQRCTSTQCSINNITVYPVITKTVTVMLNMTLRCSFHPQISRLPLCSLTRVTQSLLTTDYNQKVCFQAVKLNEHYHWARTDLNQICKQDSGIRSDGLRVQSLPGRSFSLLCSWYTLWEGTPLNWGRESWARIKEASGNDVIMDVTKGKSKYSL